MDDFFLKVLPKLAELGGIFAIAGIAIGIMGYLLYRQINHNNVIQEKRVEERAANARALEAATAAILKQSEASEAMAVSNSAMIEHNRMMREKMIEFIATVQGYIQARGPGPGVRG
jgi:hypothetical protein